jgi:lysozyme family protein
MSFDVAFSRLMGAEGSYADHPRDKGGKTMWGITEAVARANGYQGEMKSLPREKAKEIAKKAYWDPLKCDQMPFMVAFQVFDGGYNSGIGQSARWLQRALDVADDGKIGPVTLSALQKANPVAVCARYIAARGKFQTKLNNWDDFGTGWTNRNMDNLEYLADDL